MKQAGKLSILFLYFISKNCFADIFHYRNIIVGERAMGMGGAFTAVADDASGILYNPAGVAFSISNDISGSANAFYKRTTLYKKALGTENFTERSRGTTAPFFGSLQKNPIEGSGLSFAFGLYNLDSELKDQFDAFNDISTIDRFRRTANIRAGTLGAGLAVASRIMPGAAVGLAIGGLEINELANIYQHTSYTSGLYLTQDSRTHLQAQTISMTLGGQLALGAFSLGSTINYQSIYSETYDESIIRTQNYDSFNSPGGTILPVPIQSFSNTQSEKPLNSMPIEVKFGAAWFASARLLITADISYHSAAKKAIANFDREAVTNFATGAEYYITPSVPVRVGVFTNNDARPEVKYGTFAQQVEHIDYLGTSLFFAWVTPNSQISIGGVYQAGEGKAQKTGDAFSVQSVEADSITVAFSATSSY